MRRALLLVVLCGAARAQLTIEGDVVRKSTGEPIVGIRVSDLTATDANGHFRLPEMPTARGARLLFDGPGWLPRNQMVTTGAQATHVMLRVKMTPQSVISGKVLDENGWPIQLALVSAAYYRTENGVRQLQAVHTTQTDDRGAYRIGKLPPGRYYLRVRPLNVAPWSDYLPAWYPSAADVADARAIDLAEGQEASGADFHLSPGGGVEVRGRVTLPDGVRQGFLTIDGEDPVLGTRVAYVPVAPDGAITLRHVPPGKYRLTVTTTNIQDQSTPPKFMTIRTIEVKRDNIDGITLNVVPTVMSTLHGKIVSKSALQPEKVQIQLRRMEGNVQSAAKVEADGSFAIPGIWPGRYSAGAGMIGGSAVSIRFGDAEVLAWPFEFDGTEAPLVVTLARESEMARISGTVVDGSRQPVAGARVVFLPPAPGRWPPALTDQNGAFKAWGLLSGVYRVYVVEDVTEADWAMSNAEFRKAQENAFPPVNVVAGENPPLKLELPSR